MDIVGTLITGVYTLLLILDGIVYNLVNYFYEIFLFLAKINIFSNNDYEEIVQSIYIVLGVIMLFILAYSLLKAIINPDSFAKGESSFPNLVKNVLTSLIIIILLPTVFSVAFNIQNVFLNNNTIFKIILGDNSSTDTIEKSGGQMSYYTFRAFFHESEEWCTSDGNNYSVGTLRTDGSLSDDCKNFITNSDGEDLMTVDNQVYSGTRSFSAYSSFASAVNEGQIDYMFIISTLAGLFLAYVLLSFCFDLAVRVVKLAFYQIIAPIPVVCRILPGGKLKDTFSKWTKQVISLFLEVFIRIGVMCIGVLLLTKIIDNFSTIDFDLLGGFAQEQIVQALLIMGVVIFIRQCPKLIGELFGLDTGGMKLGIMDKLAMGGGLIAGAAAGGLVTAGIRNYNATRAAGGGAFSAIKSAIGGAGSAAVRSGYTARGAKKFGDVRSAASKGAAAAGAAKAKRAAYKASHQNQTVFGHNVGKIPFVGGAISVGAGHVDDLKYGISQWAGKNTSLEHLQAEQAIYQEGMGFKKDLFDLVSDNESVMAYQGLKKSAQERDLSEYTNFYKLNANGEVYDKRNGAILKDKDGNVFKNAEAAAIFTKTQEIEKYDTAVKLASMRAIHEKLQSGDGRFTAQFEKFETYKRQHADNELVNSLSMKDIDQTQLDLINQALSTNNFSDIEAAKKTLESSVGGILYNDKQFKNKNGDVTTEIAKLVQEKKQKEGNK